MEDKNKQVPRDVLLNARSSDEILNYINKIYKNYVDVWGILITYIPIIEILHENKSILEEYMKGFGYHMFDHGQDTFCYKADDSQLISQWRKCGKAHGLTVYKH